MGKTCWVFEGGKKQTNKKSRFHLNKDAVALEYVLEMWEGTSPMSEMLIFYEKTPKFYKVVNFREVCFLKRHGKHFLYFAC